MWPLSKGMVGEEWHDGAIRKGRPIAVVASKVWCRDRCIERVASKHLRRLGGIAIFAPEGLRYVARGAIRESE